MITKAARVERAAEMATPDFIDEIRAYQTEYREAMQRRPKGETRYAWKQSNMNFAHTQARRPRTP